MAICDRVILTKRWVGAGLSLVFRWVISETPAFVCTAAAIPGGQSCEDQSWRAHPGTHPQICDSSPSLDSMFCSASRSSSRTHCPENKCVQRNGQLQACSRPEPGSRARSRGELSCLLIFIEIQTK